MKRLTVIALTILLLLSFAACGEKDVAGDQTNDIPQPTTAAEPTDVLSALRTDMKPPIIAVAEFGFPELTEKFDVMDYLMDEYPKWLEEHDFIRNIPQERIIRACGNEGWCALVCIVPKDPAATVCVNVTRYMDAEPYEELGTEVAYRSESGEPILLLADANGLSVATVVVTDNEGRGVSWQPCWGNITAFPDDRYWSHLIMDFTPASEKSTSERYKEQGWVVPEASLLAGSWQSHFGYVLDLVYEPGQGSDGAAYLYEIDTEGYWLLTHGGNWRLYQGNLELNMRSEKENGDPISCALPVLIDPDWYGWLGIGRAEDGAALPYFTGDMDFDELFMLGTDSQSPYDYALSQGWRLPELGELMNTGWLSEGRYAIDLADDSVSGDNGGWVTIYDVGDIGEYTASYSGSWQYEDGMLYLSLVPKFDDGYLVDDSFPVLTMDGKLWIGRNGNGFSLPHFYPDQQMDVLQQPKG